MDAPTDRKDVIKAAIATQLRLPADALRDDATVGSLGLDSLGLAQSVVAVEGALGGEIDTERLSERLTHDMTLGELIDVLQHSLVEARSAAA